MESGLDTQAVQNFLRLTKGSQNKQDFLARVRQFDQKFLQAYPTPTMTPLPNIPRSNSSQNVSNPKNAYQPPKNPFVNTAEQKYRMAQPQRQNTNLNMASIPPQMNRTQLPNQYTGYGNTKNNYQIPHSKSQINFYQAQPQYHTQNEEYFDQHNAAFLNNFYEDGQQYRQNSHMNMMERSYSNPPQPTSARPPKNYYQGNQPYIQNNNEFINTYQAQQPQFVKYYKKVIPQPNPKALYTPTARMNPFNKP